MSVHDTSGAIVGHGRQTQAVENGDIGIKFTGHLSHLVFGDKETQVFSLKGEAYITLPPHQIGTVIAPFDAHFITDKRFNGNGGWSIGGKPVADNVPIKNDAVVFKPPQD